MRTSLLLLALLLVAPLSAATVPSPAPEWARVLSERLEAADQSFPGELGVYVRNLDTGDSLSFRAEETWYMASVVKVPVAIQVLRDVQEGRLALDSRIELLADDFVDGAGQTNAHPAGSRLRVDFLLEQMLIHSDNTATDVLIRVVGLDRINALASALIEDQGGEITTLADVRRHAYSRFHPDAFKLRSADLLAIRQAGFGDPRVAQLANVLGVPRNEFLVADLDAAFEAYYETRLNAAPISAYGGLLTALAEGEALDEAHTRWLLDVMGRVRTGDNRIKAGLPRGARFAHKTGTQHRRTCDLGVVTMPPAQGGQRAVVAACTRGTGSLAQSERALRAVGAAVTQAGVLRLQHPGSRPTP